MTNPHSMIYDGIILGAGHNSLVLQSYLCKAGLSVICLERTGVAGGGLTTIEDPGHPGFFHNTHSFYHRSLNKMPWYKDLELKRRGAIYIEPEFNVALLLRNGESLDWWTTFEKTVESFARFSKRDAQVLQKWRDLFLPIVEKILIPESQSPPIPPDIRNSLLQKSPEGRLLLQTSILSPIEFVLREFEHPTIQAGLLFFNGLREVDLRCKGFGHHIPALLASSGKAQICKGGSAELANALVSAVVENGGEIKFRTEPKKIIVDNNKATGVETSEGEIIRARHFITSGLNPQQTFLGLIDDAYVPKEWKEKAGAFKYNLIAPLFALNLNLSAPPQYKTAKKNPDIQKALMIILGLEHYSQYPDIINHHEKGTIPPTVMWGSCPTIFDPSQAPPGKHTAFMWEKLPYRLEGDPCKWDSRKNLHGKKMLELWTQYAPNLEYDVISWFTQSPLDTERMFPNMREGDLLVGAFTNGQIGYNRPFPGAGHYRGHVKGLYLCGSACHPGGNITGLPGYNCAHHNSPIEEYSIISGGSSRITKNIPPIIAISTTAGSGSEVGRAALLTVKDGRKIGFISDYLIPVATICDPELTMGMPPVLTAATGMDAISHCVECFCSPRINPVADAIALDGLERGFNNIIPASKENNRQARYEMMMCSLEGGLAFQKGLGAVHSLSHPLGGLTAKQLHHGTLNAIFLPYVLKFNLNYCNNKMQRIADVMHIDDALQVPDTFANLSKQLDLPTNLRELGITKDDLESLSEKAMIDHCTATNPRPMEIGDFRKLYFEAW